MGENRGSLSLKLCDVGDGSQSNPAFFADAIRNIYFFVLQFLHDYLRLFLLGDGSLRVSFIVATFCLLPQVKFGISAVLDGPWSSVTMPVLSCMQF